MNVHHDLPGMEVSKKGELSSAIIEAISSFEDKLQSGLKDHFCSMDSLKVDFLDFSLISLDFS